MGLTEQVSIETMYYYVYYWLEKLGLYNISYLGFTLIMQYAPKFITFPIYRELFRCDCLHFIYV